LPLLSQLSVDKRTWNTHRKRCIAYRNGFLAHLGSGRVSWIPFTDLCRRSAAFYASYLFAHENDGRTYGTLQGDPEASYQHWLDEGLEYYDQVTKRA